MVGKWWESGKIMADPLPKIEINPGFSETSLPTSYLAASVLIWGRVITH